MKNKIYIIGPVGSGKTTLSNTLSKKYNIKNYELDKIVWDDDNHTHRSETEIKQRFNNILKQKTYIIEDVGRDIFKKGRKEADIIYYIKLSKPRIYLRIVKRWLKQKLNIEKYNYRPTIKGLFQMFSWAYKDLKNRNQKIKQLKKDNKNITILNYKEIIRIIKR